MEEGGKSLKQSKSPLHNAVVVERGFRGEVKKQNYKILLIYNTL
jgi:hypothetical protein